MREGCRNLQRTNPLKNNVNIMIKQNEKTKVAPNSEKLPFSEYYDRLKEQPKNPGSVTTPLDDFLLIAARATGKHMNSIRRWAYGTAKPNYLERKAMADLLNSESEVLFPDLP